MKKNKQLAVAVLTVATLATSSVFADSRRSEETRARNDDWRGGRIERRERNADRYESRNEARRDRTPYYAQGKISDVRAYGDGYRVWVGGARYPFHVPRSHWNRDRFRVGVSIHIGGIFNPGGYYDYYDDRHDRYGRGDSRADLRGVVESVDRRRDTFVIRNDATGSFVTVVNRDRGRVRAGDYVELFGDWSRNGIFYARDVDRVDGRYYR